MLAGCVGRACFAGVAICSLLFALSVPMLLGIGNLPEEAFGQDVLTLSNLGKHFGERRLFADANLVLRRAERVALTGPDGAGRPQDASRVATAVASARAGR